MHFRSYADLTQLVRRHVHRLPGDIDLVVYVPRSGIIPAAQIALHRNPPIVSLDAYLQGREAGNPPADVSARDLRAAAPETRPARIVICFFGITRSLPHTLPALRDRVLEPARRLGEVTIYAHFFRERRIVNRRSGEDVAVSKDDWRLLDPDWCRLDEPDVFLGEIGADRIAAFGDVWEDGGQSRRNLLHQLRSLDLVSRAATAGPGADLYIFCRPDLEYHDDFGPVLRRMLDTEPGQAGVVALPDWQHWGGYNDRFAICRGAGAARVYGGRLHEALAYCETGNTPLHGEKLLRHVLRKAGIAVVPIRLRASRVRADGQRKAESFIHHRLLAAKMALIAAAYRVYTATGLARLRKRSGTP